MPLFEVEQKFSYNVANLQRIFNNGRPPFKQLVPIKTQAFTDTYYDSQDKLSKSGLWVRKRHISGDLHADTPQGVHFWEAKRRAQGSSVNRSTFEETQDEGQMLRMVRKHVPECLGPENNFGLDMLCKFDTVRDSFLADGKFTVVLDHTDFGHQVGEVELMAEDAEKAHADIDAFLKEYAWFFDTTNPKGKLTAYFEKFGYPK